MGRDTQGFAALPPAQRQLTASIGSLNRWSRVNSREERTAALSPARAARQKQWEQTADPEGVLSLEELAAAVDRLKKAHFRRMALASAKKRGSRKAA